MLKVLDNYQLDDEKVYVQPGKFLVKMEVKDLERKLIRNPNILLL